MLLTEGDRSTWRKPRHSATFSTTNRNVDLPGASAVTSRRLTVRGAIDGVIWLTLAGVGQIDHGYWEIYTAVHLERRGILV